MGHFFWKKKKKVTARFPVWWPGVAEIGAIYLVLTVFVAITVLYGVAVTTTRHRLLAVVRQAVVDHAAAAARKGNSPNSNDSSFQNEDAISSTEEFRALATEIADEMGESFERRPIRFAYMGCTSELISVVYAVLTTLLSLIVATVYAKLK